MKPKTLFISLIASLLIFGTMAVSEAGAAVRIMPLGDSNTWGFGSSDDTGYRRFLYLSLIAAGYDVDFVGGMITGIPDDFDRDHEGHPGFVDEEVAEMVYGWLTANPPDIVLLHIGTNMVEENAEAVENILNEIDRYETDNAARIWVILARIINRSCITDDPPCPDSAITSTFNGNVAAMAQARIDMQGDKILIVDMENGAGIDYALTTDEPPGDMWDLIHPFDGGYQKMAGVWLPAVEEAIRRPIADAGPDQIVSEGVLVTLDGSGSFDGNGDPLQYQWEQTVGPPVELSDTLAVQPTFTAPITLSKDLLGFRLTVSDPLYSDTDAVEVLVTRDLLFTSVTPCRIVDTRLGAGGVFLPGETREFYVYGPSTDIASQGGNPDGCLAPPDEPSAVHINLTAVPEFGSGNLVVFPVNVPPPNASLTNYRTGIQNIANAATVYLGFSPNQIQVQNRFGTAHVVIDVMGYYYPEP